MKRIFFGVFTFFFAISIVNAYNPPVNSDGLFELSSAKLLSNASSVSGGGVFNANVSSVTVNPALVSNEQRVSLNLGYTLLVSSNSENSKSLGSALQLGMIIPTKYTVFDFYLNGTFVPFKEMNLANSFNVKLGMAKEITEKLSVGFGLNTGSFWGAGNDWSLSCNLGTLFSFGKVGFIKDMRMGVSILNLGKNFNSTTCIGMNSDESVTAFPNICTIKAGVSGLFVNSPNVKLGFSFDLQTPLLQNVLADLGLECSIKDIVYISIAEKINLSELELGHKDLIPSIGLGFKFSFGFNKNDFFEKNGWKESEISSTFAYKQMYETINCISTEVDMKLGMKDNAPPVIQLWLDEDEGDE